MPTFTEIFAARLKVLLSGLLVLMTSATTRGDETPGSAYVPYHASGVYAPGEKVGWNVLLPWESTPVRYVIRKNNREEIKRGVLQTGVPETIEVQGDEPEMIYVQISRSSVTPTKALGAAVAPERIAASIPAPKDFEGFWADKVRKLRDIGANPVLTAAVSEKDGVDFAVLRLDQIDGRHVWAQIAKPHDVTGKRKFPALVMFEYGVPHYLPKETVTDKAFQGWLAVNVEPHDARPDMPQAYYDGLPESMQQFDVSGPHDRDHYHLLYLYLGNIRVIDYLASRTDWDGKTLVVMGTSSGGLQALCAAGLSTKVTAVLGNVPAGADADGVAHGRQVGWPWLGVNDPNELETAQYFDSANCAKFIRSPALVSLGFIDTLTPPTGIWAAYNAIPAIKEVVPMRDSPHVNLATAGQLRSWTERSESWLESLRTGYMPIQSPALR